MPKRTPSQAHRFRLSLSFASLAFLFGMNAVAATYTPERATLELHAHLFMKEGMGWLFSGDFEGPLRAKNWKSRFNSQANPESLERSEIGVVVATLYAHPLFTLNLRQSIRRQIAQAEKFVAEHPNWIIARDAAQARAAINQGKRVMILALEGASGVIENEADLREFVDEKGIRIVTLLHLTDDRFGGVAFLKGLRALASPWAWLSQLLKPAYENEVRINTNGLSTEGREMTEALIRRHVWIDLAHSSDAATRALISIQEKEKLPLLYTHTSLRKYLGAERGISDWELKAVQNSNGIVGLMPCEEMLEGTPVPPQRCAANCGKACEGGIHALSVQYEELAAVLGSDSVSLGSDYNGGIQHLHPACPVGAGLDAEGLWNIGQQPEIWNSLEKLGVPTPQPRRRMIDRFLDAWARVK